MEAIACVNGRFVAEPEARISIFDRGFLFGDGVYEVVPVVDGRMVDLAAHRARLLRSLAALRIDLPVSPEELDRQMGEVVARNAIGEGRVYLQVTRGAADREFPFPGGGRPTLILFGREAAVLDTPAARAGLRVQTTADNRWGRRDIKTVMLLPAVLAKQVAKEEGFDDAWFVKDDEVTEGASSNAYVVRDGRVYTRPLSADILPGCTRATLLALAAEAGEEILERSFTVAEAYGAEEAFITSATTLVTPVVEIDGHRIGTGKPGPVAARLRALYIRHARRGAG
jgi:D-alanine transaminase